jgi:hypothetical protein
MAVKPDVCIDGVPQGFHNLYTGSRTGGEKGRHAVLKHIPVRTVHHHYG